VTAKRGRGHRVGLTREDVLRAAVRLADDEGVAAVSMRRVASELGVEAMTLYHHVAGKDALLDGMVEEVLRSARSPQPSDDWQAVLREYARTLREALLTHPALISLVATRPALTTRNQDLVEAVLTALCSHGFEPKAALDVLHSLAGFVVGHVVLDTATPDTDGSDVDASTHPLLHEAMSSGRRTARFDAALDALVTGFQATLARQPGR
jgi:AcrR family transcriptional regulator